MTLVVDASVVVAALVDGGATGAWAVQQLQSEELAAPHLMPVETAEVLRRASMAGKITNDSAALAHADLGMLRVSLFPYSPFARRTWELRGNLTSYDAWYVALAEGLDAELVTLDERLARAAGPRCDFRLAPGIG